MNANTRFPDSDTRQLSPASAAVSANILALRLARESKNEAAIREAQQAYDKAVNAFRAELQIRARKASVLERLEQIHELLSKNEVAKLKDIHAGFCTQERAEYLMNAAAVAGGAVFVNCPPIRNLTDVMPNIYIAAGTLPSGEQVATFQRTVANITRSVRDQIRCWASPQTVLTLEDPINEALKVLAWFEDPNG